MKELKMMTRFEQGYNKGVSDCLVIMQELSEQFTTTEAEQMYIKFLNRVRHLKDRR